MPDRLLPRSAAGALAAASAIVLVLIAGQAPYVVLVGGCVAALGLLGSAEAWRRERLTSCALVCGSALLMLAATLCVTVWGLPGGAARRLDASAATLIALGLLAPVLMATDRARRARPTTTGAPYAR